MTSSASLWGADLRLSDRQTSTLDWPSDRTFFAGVSDTVALRV
jgi:hypothetical protein